MYEAVEEEIDQTYLTDNPDKSQVLISDAFDAAETLAMEVEVLSKATAPLLGERNFSVAAEKSKDLIYETILSLSEALRRRKSRDDRRTLFLAIQSWSDATHDSFEKMDDEEQDQFLADEIARILAKRTKSEGEGE
ncbi:hypothetical protein [Aurantimonas endophytica]|uniref:Uncharacterized protein n=1 Tax=Aurantimonas endophytica TaxID=1522175 RepID=A0A7W6HAI9_9HYPH|nr:hypothetical protein [Aurantimonas endophytica]MBB4001568.1 hypothetical protein [Aurantimonas endophytica]MCO6402792.1 hypothetical protein [Aurantimonas endophytica]